MNAQWSQSLKNAHFSNRIFRSSLFSLSLSNLSFIDRVEEKNRKTKKNITIKWNQRKSWSVKWSDQCGVNSFERQLF